LYQRGAEQGHPSAQYNLGNAFYHGKGVAQSHDEAVKWYRLAAAQGQVNALYNLGVCYSNGLGALHEALPFFKRAAAKGHDGATAAVGKVEALLAAPSGRPA
jgi:hypothetical protein